MTNIFSVKTNGSWWKGTVSMRYNLLTVAKCFLAIILLAVAGFVIYWFGVGLWALAQLLWDGVCWFFGALWSGLCWLASQWMWLLGLALLALLGWLLSKINWKKIKLPERQPSDKERSWNWLWWVLLAIILLLLALLLFKNCGGSSGNDNAQQELVTPVISETEYNIAFDKVVIARAYLDGVQSGDTKTERALVGFKFVNGEAVTKMTFVGKTYDEAKNIVAQDWAPVICNNVRAKLTEDQLVVVVLFAMRNGKYGFEKSDFLREINAGNFDVSTMALHKSDGTKRELREEATQYLWVLKNLWLGNLTTDMLLDCPMFSYKSITSTRMYDTQGNLRFDDTIKARLQRGANQTPRKALEL
jgi:hypothetical protein